MSGPVVVKFGGSSFPSARSYTTLAGALSDRIGRDGPMVVVVSAMAGETEQLRDRLHEVNDHPADSSAAGLLTLADTISAHLLAAALGRQARSAVVLAGHQLGITAGSGTDSSAMWSRIASIDPEPLQRAIAKHDAVIVPGGQAVDDSGRPAWLGKNSSDLSAVAVAVALGADRCEIHSDVDGIYSSDPNLVQEAGLIRAVSYETAAVMAQYGAKVLHWRAVELARQHGVTIICRRNTPPFEVGTTIGTTAGRPAAVITNHRSVVLRYGDDAQADLAHSVFRAHGIDTVRLADGPLLAVIGGYVDLEGFRSGNGLPFGQPVGIPVTELVGSKVTVHIASDEMEAIHLARQLHNTVAGRVSFRSATTTPNTERRRRLS